VTTESRGGRGGITPLSDAIEAFLKQAGVRATPKHTRIFEAWTAQLSENEKQRATPLKFFHGTLTVEVSSSVYLHELKITKNETYRRQANERLGEEQIRKVRFKLQG